MGKAFFYREQKRLTNHALLITMKPHEGFRQTLHNKKTEVFILKNSKTLLIARTAVICALYVALTYAFMSVAYGPIQIRIGEGLTLLPLIYPESIIALFLGCILSNIASPFGFYDISIGSVTTLLAAVCTYFIGRFVKNKPLKLVLGGLPPILFNAFFLPLMWLLFDLDTGYVMNMLSILATQAIFVYAIGVPLYIALEKLQSKGVKGFEIVPILPPKKTDKTTDEQ